MTVLRGWNKLSIEQALALIANAAKARVPEYSNGRAWSLCELGFDEDDYSALCCWLDALHHRTVDSYSETAALLCDRDGQIVPVMSDGSGVPRCLVEIEDPSLARWMLRSKIESWLRRLDAGPRRAATLTVA